MPPLLSQGRAGGGKFQTLGLGKGLRKSKRHRHLTRDTIQGISEHSRAFCSPLLLVPVHTKPVVRRKALTDFYSKKRYPVSDALCFSPPSRSPLPMYLRLLLLADQLEIMANSDGDDYRRLARRGGVKRISATTYEEMRLALKDYLKRVCSCPVTSGSATATARKRLQSSGIWSRVGIGAYFTPHGNRFFMIVLHLSNTGTERRLPLPTWCLR